jgi:AraC-like DNA-binding protein
MKQPQTSFSTAGVLPDKAASFWNDILVWIKVGGTVIPKQKDVFFASVDHYPFKNIPLFFCCITPTQYKRTQRDCLAKNFDYYGLMHIKEGSGEITQEGRTVVVHPGDCVFLNYKRPYFSRNSDFLRFSEFHIPSEVVKTWVPEPNDVTAIPFSRRSDWGKALAETMGALTPETLKQSHVTNDILFEHIGCLLSLSSNEEKRIKSITKTSLLQRFRQILHERHVEPDFSASRLAEECGVSIRTLYSVFASIKSSFRRELLSIRMESARCLLDDQRFDHMSIAEIGPLVGFADDGHFKTCFSKAHGVSASLYRAVRRS